jgi:hypothetical protein
MRENLAKEELASLRRAVMHLDWFFQGHPGGSTPVIAASGTGDWVVYPAMAETDEHGLTQHSHKDTLPDALRAAGVPEDECEALSRALGE